MPRGKKKNVEKRLPKGERFVIIDMRVAIGTNRKGRRMEVLKPRKAIFFADRVQLIGFGNVAAGIEDIDCLEYVRPTLLNYLLFAAGFGASGPGPGILCIRLNRKIGGTALYSFRMKAKEVRALPPKFREKF